jgi:ribosomal protein L13
MVVFFNSANANVLVKNASKILIDGIKVNQKIYVPMLARVFDLQESQKYDNLTDPDKILKEELNLSKNKRHYQYHTNPEQFV